jgi:hypothetical protein
LETEEGSTLAEDLEAEEALMVLKVGNSLLHVFLSHSHHTSNKKQTGLFARPTIFVDSNSFRSKTMAPVGPSLKLVFSYLPGSVISFTIISYEICLDTDCTLTYTSCPFTKSDKILLLLY